MKTQILTSLLFILSLIGTNAIGQDYCAKMPVKNGTLGSSFGWRMHPSGSGKKFHTGLDIRAKYGNDVYAAFDGKILEVKKNNKAYGHTIKILHENGLVTFYAHLSRIEVEKGQKVTKGNVIGKIGTTGNATGPHLHFEIREKDEKLNPLLFL